MWCVLRCATSDLGGLIALVLGPIAIIPLSAVTPGANIALLISLLLAVVLHRRHWLLSGVIPGIGFAITAYWMGVMWETR